MKNIKEMARNLLVFILLMVLTFMLVFKNYDFNTTMDIILNTDVKYILLAILAMFLNISFESLNIKKILGTLGHNISLGRMIGYTLVGFFFSGITPAAGGGQPMEVYYMKKEGIPVTSSMIALLIETCAFHIITIICGIIGVIVNYKLLNSGLILIFAVGMFLKTVILMIMLICLFSRKLSNLLVRVFIKFLTKIKYHDLENVKNDIHKALEQYHDSSKYIREHRGIFLKSLIIVSIQVMMYYSVTYFVYKAFGLNSFGYFKIITLQALLFVSVASIPLPGAVGVSESAFLKLYTTLFDPVNLAGALILTRGINFYIFMIISMIVVIITLIRRSRK